MCVCTGIEECHKVVDLRLRTHDAKDPHGDQRLCHRMHDARHTRQEQAAHERREKEMHTAAHGRGRWRFHSGNADADPVHRLFHVPLSYLPDAALWGGQGKVVDCDNAIGARVKHCPPRNGAVARKAYTKYK